MEGEITKSITLDVTADMAPESRIFAYILYGGEVVADAVTLKVDGAFKNQVCNTVLTSVYIIVVII